MIQKSNNPSRTPWKPENGQWLIIRTDTQVRDRPVDIYVLLEAPSLYAHGFEFVSDEKVTKKQYILPLGSGTIPPGTRTKRFV